MLVIGTHVKNNYSFIIQSIYVDIETGSKSRMSVLLFVHPNVRWYVVFARSWIR